MSAVLIVVDVQTGFIRPASAPVVEPILQLVGEWRRAGRPVVFTRYNNYPGSPFERLVKWSEMQPGTDDVEIVPELKGEAALALVVDKTGYTSLTPDVLAFLAEHQVTDVFVCGIATESCVLKTAVDAFEQGFTPWVVVDACASHGGVGPHEAGLLVLRRFIGAGQLVSAADVLAGLS